MDELCETQIPFRTEVLIPQLLQTAFELRRFQPSGSLEIALS